VKLWVAFHALTSSKLASSIYKFVLSLLCTIFSGDNMLLDKFQTTAKMSTYLLAFIICDFTSKETTTRTGTTVSEHVNNDITHKAIHFNDTKLMQTFINFWLYDCTLGNF